ncbi:MAG: hypothetical protein QXX17_03540 [Conexivisphaerales archaeon]
MKINNIAFVSQLITSLSYIAIFVAGIGYPAAAESLIIFIVRLVMGSALLVNAKKAHYVAIAGTPVGIVYSASTLLVKGSPLIALPLLLELLAVFLAITSLRSIGKTKQPSPLDMPVYG